MAPRNNVDQTEVILTAISVPPATDGAVSAWMQRHGWAVSPPVWTENPDAGFHVWQEDSPSVVRSHALWIDEAMIRHLAADALVKVLDREQVAEAIRISFKIRIEERGAEYRVSVVPRQSGEIRRVE
jgi:hypothetical protein